MDDIDWKSVILGLVAGWASLLGIVIARTIYNRTRRLYFAAENWKATYFERDAGGGWVYLDKPSAKTEHAQLRGTIKFFSRKPMAVALHKLAIEVRHGKHRWGKLIHRTSELSHGNPLPSQHKISHAKLTELTIPKDEWVPETIHGFAKDFEAIQGASLWFAATTAEGKRRLWYLSRLPD